MKTVLANVFLPTLFDVANNTVEPEPACNQMGQYGTILLTTLSNKVKKTLNIQDMLTINISIKQDVVKLKL